MFTWPLCYYCLIVSIFPLVVQPKDPHGTSAATNNMTEEEMVSGSHGIVTLFSLHCTIQWKIKFLIIIE